MDPATPSPQQLCPSPQECEYAFPSFQQMTIKKLSGQMDKPKLEFDVTMLQKL